MGPAAQNHDDGGGRDNRHHRMHHHLHDVAQGDRGVPDGQPRNRDDEKRHRRREAECNALRTGTQAKAVSADDDRYDER